MSCYSVFLPVFTFQKTPSSPLTCHITSFFISRAELVWKKNWVALKDIVDFLSLSSFINFNASACIKLYFFSPEDKKNLTTDWMTETRIKKHILKGILLLETNKCFTNMFKLSIKKFRKTKHFSYFLIFFLQLFNDIPSKVGCCFGHMLNRFYSQTRTCYISNKVSSNIFTFVCSKEANFCTKRWILSASSSYCESKA